MSAAFFYPIFRKLRVFCRVVSQNFRPKGSSSMKLNQTLPLALVGAALTTSFAASGANQPVASFARIEGVAVVSKGAQYVKASEGMPLAEGDRLMVMEGGKAIIAFADGCQREVADNELLTIGAKSTCASDAVGAYKVQEDTAVSQNSLMAGGGLQNAALGGVVTGAGVSGGAIAAGVLGAIVIAGAADDDTSGDSKAQYAPLGPSPSP